MLEKQKYKYGFVTEVSAEKFAKGLDEEVIRRISMRKEEPSWMLDLRLKAYRHWLTLKEPKWAGLKYAPIDYQDIHYYSTPTTEAQKKSKSLDEVDPELLKTFERLGIPLSERKRLAGVAVDVVFDSVSLGTTHQDTLKKAVLFFVPFRML